MADEYIDNENMVSYNKYKEPHDSNAATKEKSCNKQVPTKNVLVTCFQVEDEATFETFFVLCDECINYKRDRAVASTRNGKYYKCSVLWGKKDFGNKKRKTNSPSNFNERLLNAVDDKPNQEESKRRSNRKITPNQKYVSDKNAEACNQPIEEICNATINIGMSQNNYTIQNKPIIDKKNTTTTTSTKFKKNKELEREIQSLKASLNKLEKKYDQEVNKLNKKKASLESKLQQSQERENQWFLKWTDNNNIIHQLNTTVTDLKKEVKELKGMATRFVKNL